MNMKGLIGTLALLITIAILGCGSPAAGQGARRIEKRTTSAKPTKDDIIKWLTDYWSLGPTSLSIKDLRVTSVVDGPPSSQSYMVRYEISMECFVAFTPSPFGGDIFTCEKGEIIQGAGIIQLQRGVRAGEWDSVSVSPWSWFQQDARAPASANKPAVSIEATPTSTAYDKFLGVWTYIEKPSNDKRCFKITKDQRGKFLFTDGFEWNDKITWAQTMVNDADGIFLKPLNGKLQGKFVSPDFRATHGHDFTYQITLQLQPNGSLLYLLGGDLQEKHVATKP
jgi:hypothetical protein